MIVSLKNTDMFNCFKDQKGNFKECLSKDIKGLLSLHEASYLGFEGENLLDEAMEFTTMHLKDLKGDVSRTLKEEVRHSLEMPLHRRMRRLEQRWYIDAYNMNEAHNRKLLELAKLDFNIVQSVHQRDLKDMSQYNSQHVPIILHIVHTKFILPKYILHFVHIQRPIFLQKLNQKNYSYNF